MYIKMMDNGVCVIIKKDVSPCLWIPLDPENRHYMEYLAWLAEPNTPTEEDI